jgi:hypothetical protein
MDSHLQISWRIKAEKLQRSESYTEDTVTYFYLAKPAKICELMDME